MKSSPGRVVIIGSGLIGTLSAYYLQKTGWKVIVLDKGELGRAASFGNCGFICPSHILPLAEPGVIGKTFKALFAKNSPFSIKPRLDPALWSWLIRFALRCNERDMLDAAQGIHAMLESSMHEYRELVERESLDCEWESRGLLFPYRSQQALDAYDSTNDLLAESFNTPAKKLSAAETVHLEPALKEGLAGSWYYDDDAHLRPDKLLASLRALLRDRGVEFLPNHEVTSFRVEGNYARAARLQSGELEADEFIVAAGALTPFLSTHLGCRIPIQPGKGYSLTMSRPSVCPSIPLIFSETRVAVTPFATGYRLGSTMEFAGYDDTINPARLQLLKDGAAPYLREPYCEPIEERWYGWRPMTYDSLPIIDRSPALDNILIAAGHNMLGLSMATGTGRLVAELLNNETPHIDPTPYRVSRFSE